MAVPSLLLKPGGSRDRSGPIAPVVQGNVTLVQGRYGLAWHPAEVSAFVEVPIEYLPDPIGTILVRGWYGNVTGTTYLLRAPASTGFLLGRASGLARFSRGGNSLPGLAPINAGQFVTQSVRYSETAARIFLDGAPDSPVQPMSGNLRNGFTLRIANTASTDYNNYVESVLIFDGIILPDAEIARISNLPTSWTWENVQPQLGGLLRIGSPEPLGILRVGSPAPISIARRGGG